MSENTTSKPQQRNSIKVLLTFVSFLIGVGIVVFAGNLLYNLWYWPLLDTAAALFTLILFFLIIVPLLIWNSIILVPYQSIWILQRLGKSIIVKDAGVRIKVPFIDEVFSVEDLRRQEMEIEANEALTRKGTTVDVTAALFWQFLPEDPSRFIQEVQDPSAYIMRVAEAAVRRLISSQSIEELQEIDEADEVALNDYLDEQVGEWASAKIEIIDIVLPDSIKEALAQVEKAEQEAKAEKIRAEAETQVMISLTDAIRGRLPDADEDVIMELAMKLRTLGTVRVAGSTLSVFDIADLVGVKSSKQA